jgi:hypothetical protein
MRRLVWVLLLLALASCRRKQTTPPEEPGGGPTVVQARGAVWRALPDGQRQPLAGGAVGEGDILATGDDGGAVVRLGPGREIELRPNARLKLRREQGQLVAELESGLVVSRSTAAAPSVVLTVLTPFGITRVPGGRGEATIGVDKDGVHIAVSLGEIAFVDPSGKTVTAGANESIEVKLGSVELIRAGAVAPPERLEVVLSSEIGPLLVRAPGERTFSARRAAPAPSGTGFRLGSAGGRARLVAPGLRARLEGGASGRVGEASRSSGGRRFALALEKGTALLSLEGGQAHEVVLEGREPITLRATEPSTFSVVANKGRATVVALAGGGEVSVGDSRQRLAANQRASIRGSAVEVASRSASDVVLPTARGLRVYADGLPDVTLSWPSQGQGALVEVAGDPEFKDVLVSGRVSGNSITVPAPRRADLYWRVTGTSGEKVLVGQAHFEPDRRRSVLDLEHPHNLVGESGPMTTVYFQGVVPTLTFSYASRAGAARYRLRVYRVGALDKPIVEKVVADTRCQVDANSLIEGSYVWHAVPLDGKGGELGGGRMNKLELVYDNALTRLAIGSPKPNEQITGPEVSALGVAPLGSRLYINGKQARLDGKGRFAEKVNRAPAVIFRLVGKNGSESYWIRKLRVGS